MKLSFIKLIEKFVYSFGHVRSHYNVSREMKVLKKQTPDFFKNKNTVDLGCGDGKTSKKLVKILEPKTFLGVDLSEALIVSAKKRGISAKVTDISRQKISGQIGILWGVVHHLSHPAKTLKKLKDEFDGLIIRESIDEKRFLELGNKYNKSDLKKILISANINIIKEVNVPQNKSVIIYSKCK